MNRNHMHPWRHHFLQIFQYQGPRKRLALDQFIQELRLVARVAVFRTIQKFLRVGPDIVPVRNQGALLRHRIVDRDARSPSP